MRPVGETVISAFGASLSAICTKPDGRKRSPSILTLPNSADRSSLASAPMAVRPVPIAVTVAPGPMVTSAPGRSVEYLVLPIPAA